MLSTDGLLQSDTDTAALPGRHRLRAEFGELLEQAFGRQFAILDGSTGEVLCEAADQPARDWLLRAELCREVARRQRPELIEEEDPFVVLAVPRALPDGGSLVAVATFLTRQTGPQEDLGQAAGLLAMHPLDAATWAGNQTPWSADALLRIGQLVLTLWSDRRRVEELEDEAASLSLHLSNTYEEISLLYRLTQNLKISQSDEELGRVALEWLKEVLPAEAVAIQLVPTATRDRSLSHHARTETLLLSCGDCPVDNRQFTALMQRLEPGSANRPVVVNRQLSGRQDWPHEKVHQMIVVTLTEGKNLFGWLAALNHVDGAEFGTVEASLLSSVAAILGIHNGNIELYRQQSELMAGIVRALTSAIDAKDPYTCGHSDRVARVAVRLAEELGCEGEALNTIYLSGLLHDIGKIGIDDHVLRKPARLSEDEFKHIKRHVEIGHKILSDLGRLDEVLPVILHHHESWDGGGYPHRLGSDKIPLAARIVAVADAFDAMSSDRPYRKGMPDEKIDAIFRAGAGQQWDAKIVTAFFRARNDVRDIARSERDDADVDLQPWQQLPNGHGKEE